MGVQLSQAREKLEKYGQTHVLKYYEELSGIEQEALLAQIGNADMEMIDSCRHQEELLKRGVITPLAAMQLEEIETYRESFTATGLEAIRGGKVGAVLLAGGMGQDLAPTIPRVYTMWGSQKSSIFLNVLSVICWMWCGRRMPGSTFL